jgi:hypothetical protein
MITFGSMVISAALLDSLTGSEHWLIIVTLIDMANPELGYLTS